MLGCSEWTTNLTVLYGMGLGSRSSRGDGRRRWPDEVKAQIVTESLEPGAVVTHVARRHGCRPQQVHDWLLASQLA